MSHPHELLPESAEDGRPNPYRSASQWRHQESNAYAKHAGEARDPHTASANTKDLTNFLNSARVEPEHGADGAGNFQPIVIDEGAGPTDGAADIRAASHDGKEVICGPLLNYRRQEGNVWYGSVLVVTKGGGKTQRFQPTLTIGRVEVAHNQQGLVGEGSAANGTSHTNGPLSTQHGTEVLGKCLYSDPRNTFWQFSITCDMLDVETKWAYSIVDVRYKSSTQPTTNYFFVPATTESMRIMFHSCNGFSVGTDEDAWSGPALWNDVLRRHAENPFHVMIGGGDQIYNDGIRVDGPLRPWSDIGNPKKRRDYPFPGKLRDECDEYYLQNYIRWYSTEPFAEANGQIPQLNIWDDHDIIDGFGSYVNEFMKCDVFRGIGGTAHKYYMLFQHHLAPPASTYTTDAPTTMEAGDGVDKNQLQDTFVSEPTLQSEPGYIIGQKPGPYVAEHSMNMFSRLGARIAFLGIDARTERTRHQVNYPETYDLIFNRLRQELGAAQQSGNGYKHMILLLGIPIAYPRLTWLENVFSSPLIAPMKFLNRRFGFGGGLFNHFDGSVDLLDDLDDHYTAKTHKKERNGFVERLQAICEEFSIRITILGGDVHLAALGRFYSNPDLKIPTLHDHRYMVNVVSSAIVNKPPPAPIANLLAKRNKIHHLNADTDETLMSLFDKDPGSSNKTMASNHVTMPSRNYAILTENSPNNHAAAANGSVNGATNGTDGEHGAPAESHDYEGKDGHTFLHKGETGAGTKHKAASPATHGKANDGSLDCCIRVEIDQHNREGHTEPYGLTIPLLEHLPGKYPAPHHHRLHLPGKGSRPGSAARPGTTTGAGVQAGLRPSSGAATAASH